MNEYIDEIVIREAMKVNTLKKAYDAAIKVGDNNFAKTLEYILEESGARIKALAR